MERLVKLLRKWHTRWIRNRCSMCGCGHECKFTYLPSQFYFSGRLWKRSERIKTGGKLFPKEYVENHLTRFLFLFFSLLQCDSEGDDDKVSQVNHFEDIFVRSGFSISPFSRRFMVIIVAFEEQKTMNGKLLREFRHQSN